MKVLQASFIRKSCSNVHNIRVFVSHCLTTTTTTTTHVRNLKRVASEVKGSFRNYVIRSGYEGTLTTHFDRQKIVKYVNFSKCMYGNEEESIYLQK